MVRLRSSATGPPRPYWCGWRRPERPDSTLRGRFSETGTVERVSGSVPGRIEVRSARFVQKRYVARANGRGGRSRDGRAGRVRTGSWAGQMRTSVRRCCKYLSHPTDACRSVGAERSRGSLLRSSSSHPFRPRGRRRHCSHACPVAGGGSVSSAVERPAAPDLARSRFDQPGVGCGSRRLVG